LTELVFADGTSIEVPTNELEMALAIFAANGIEVLATINETDISA